MGNSSSNDKTPTPETPIPPLDPTPRPPPEEPIQLSEGIISQVFDDFSSTGSYMFTLDKDSYWLKCDSKNFSKAYLLMSEESPVRVYWKRGSSDLRYVLDIERAVSQVHVTYIGTKGCPSLGKLEIVTQEPLMVNNRYIRLLYEKRDEVWNVGSAYHLTIELYKDPNFYQITEVVPDIGTV